MHIITAATRSFYPQLISWIQTWSLVLPELEKEFTSIRLAIWTWPSATGESDTEWIELITQGARDNNILHWLDIYVLPSSQLPYGDWLVPNQFAWKAYIIDAHLQSTEVNDVVIYSDVGISVNKNPTSWIRHAKELKKSILFEDKSQINRTWTHPTCVREMNVTVQELERNQLIAGLQILVRTDAVCALVREWRRWCDIQSVCHGHHTFKYSSYCQGHRHDQSILSILIRRRPYKDAIQLVAADRIYEWRRFTEVPKYATFYKWWPDVAPAERHVSRSDIAPF